MAESDCLTLTISSVRFLQADASYRSQCLPREMQVSETQRAQHEQTDGADDGCDELFGLHFLHPGRVCKIPNLNMDFGFSPFRAIH